MVTTMGENKEAQCTKVVYSLVDKGGCKSSLGFMIALERNIILLNAP